MSYIVPIHTIIFLSFVSRYYLFILIYCYGIRLFRFASILPCLLFIPSLNHNFILLSYLTLWSCHSFYLLFVFESVYVMSFICFILSLSVHFIIFLYLISLLFTLIFLFSFPFYSRLLAFFWHIPVFFCQLVTILLSSYIHKYFHRHNILFQFIFHHYHWYFSFIPSHHISSLLSMTSLFHNKSVFLL